MPLDNPYQSLTDKFGFIPVNHEKPNWFDVKIGPVYDDKGKPIAGYRRVHRDDSGDTLGVHSEKYNLIPYSASFDAFDRAIATCGLNTKDMHIATDLTQNGARCFRQYLFPAHQIDMGKGDVSALRIIMFNSYDGSYPFCGRAGAYRFVCANTSVMGTDVAKVGMKHVGKRDYNVVIEGLVKQAADAMRAMERMREWSKIIVGDTEAWRNIFKHFPQSSDRFVDMMISRLVMLNTPQHGTPSMWDVYNMLTAWSTHDDAGKSPMSEVRKRREERVAACINDVHWKEVERDVRWAL